MVAKIKNKNFVKTFMTTLSGLIVKPIKRLVGKEKDDVDSLKGEYLIKGVDY